MKKIVFMGLFVAGIIQLEACSYFQSTDKNDKLAQCQALRTRMMNYSMGQRYGSGSYTINNSRQDAQTVSMQRQYDQLNCDSK